MNKERKIIIATFALLAVMVAGGCIPKISSTEVASTEPAVETTIPTKAIETTSPTKPVEQAKKSGRKDGERFEETIILEGMEEKVQYEHVKNETLGFEIDYDYESFVRQSDGNKEKFISVYDDLKKPENYLEITSSKKSLDAAADTVIKTLSKKYKVEKESFTLNNAGNCIRIDASVEPDGVHMPNQLQMVYIVPAVNGSIVATAHYAIEASEGFGRRFAYIMHTLEVIK